MILLLLLGVIATAVVDVVVVVSGSYFNTFVVDVATVTVCCC